MLYDEFRAKIRKDKETQTYDQIIASLGLKYQDRYHLSRIVNDDGYIPPRWFLVWCGIRKAPSGRHYFYTSEPTDDQRRKILALSLDERLRRLAE